MGNKFNKKTTVILRPAVCKSPPPPKHPEPPENPTVPCCSDPIPIVLNGKVENVLFCPGFTGQTFFLVYDDTTGHWTGAIVVLGKNFGFDLHCPVAGTSIDDWILGLSGDCVSGFAGPPQTPKNCSPFQLTYPLAMAIGICPAICAGFVRNWKLTIQANPF